MSQQTVDDYLSGGGTINHISSGQHSENYLSSQSKKPQNGPLPKHQIPSAKSCHKCHHYNRGNGDKKCINCSNYKLMDMEDLRATITIIPMVSELIESFPAPARPDNDLMAIVRTLPAQNAAIISLCYYGGLSIREISDFLAIPQSSAYKKLYRAVSNLRKIISDKYPHVKSSSSAKVSNLVSPI